MRHGLWLALPAVVVAWGCRDKTPRPDPTTSPTEVAGLDGSTPPVVPSTARVGLLDSGAEPRAPLRYRLSVGDTQMVVLRLGYSATNRLRASAPTEVVMPGIKLVFHVEIVEALTGDRVRYRFDLAEAALINVGGADKGLVATATKALKQAQGIRGSAVVDGRGFIRDGTIEIPDQLDPLMQVMIDSMRSSMEQLSTPLPEEPVGLGARWEFAQSLSQGGTVLDQTTIFELISIKDGIVELAGKVEQHAGRQDIEMAGLEYVELTELTAKGTATVQLNPERLAPLSSNHQLDTESRFEFAKKSGRRQVLTTTGKATVGVAAK